MDPALQELAAASGAEEIEAIIKLRAGGEPPPHVRLVTSFGDIATCRLAGDRVEEVWAHPATLSLKAPRLLAYERELALSEESEDIELRTTDARRPTGLDATGRGVVIGAVDWGVDVAHPDLLRPDGSSRFLAVWDQRQGRGQAAPEPYGYGVVHRREAIDAALASGRVYETLDYHPEEGDPLRNGAHGTHVLGIAAGNGAVPGSPVGLAPEADLVFVHLSAGRLGGLATLGDSVRILEALDFIRRTAGDRPWVANTSLGRHSGGHRGLTLVEQGMDALLREAPGRAIVQSCGNYYLARAHACGRLPPGRSRTLTWQTGRADVTPNELEVWYSQRDRLGVAVSAPIGNGEFRAALGEITPIVIAGEEVGRIYHRRRDPTGEHHVDIFLLPGAPSGDWLVELSAVDVVDGRFDAYVERDAGCPDCQSVFHRDDSDPRRTLGSICNGFHTLAVGAYDGHDPERLLGPFSSSGPTRDGRHRPNLVAPGVAVLSARSASRSAQAVAPVTRKTGTSMAAPHVTGTIALMFEVAPRPLGIRDTHRLLLSTTEPAAGDQEFELRVGTGYLDTMRAVAAAAGGIAPLESAEEKGEQMNDRIAEAPVAAPQSILVEGVEAGRSTLASRAENRRAAETAPQVGRPEAAAQREGPAAAYGPIEACDCAGSAGVVETAEAEWALPERIDPPGAGPGEMARRAAAAMASTNVQRVLGPETVATPALIYDSFACDSVPGLCDQLADRFEVVGLPGESLERAPRSGDMVLVRALGEGDLVSAEVIVEELPGSTGQRYANVLSLEGESGAGLRRLTDGVGRLDYRTLLLRPHEGDEVERTCIEVDLDGRQARLSCFRFNSPRLRAFHLPAIRRIARHIARIGATRIRIVGHADYRGSDEYNIVLGRQRAEAVRRQLASVLDPARLAGADLSVASRGKSSPIASNRTRRGRALNRRVELAFSPPATQTRSRPQPLPLPPIVRRAIGLLNDPVAAALSRHQRQRIGCMLWRVLWRGGDDRFITAQGVLSYRNLTYRRSPGFGRVSQWLRTSRQMSDRELLRRVKNIDELILDGRHKINQLFAQMGSTVHVRVRELRDWVAARQRDRKSIYYCYRGR